MKTCATCKQNKPTTEYFKCNQHRDGLATICKDCERAYRRARYARNKTDADSLVDKVCTKCGGVFPSSEFHKTSALKGGRQNHCRSCETKRKKDYFTDPTARNKRSLSMIKSRAAREGVPFGLTIDDMIIPDVCPVLGIPILLDPNHRDNYPSVDRIIPVLGYVPGNIVIVSYRANRIKNDATIDELTKVASFYNAIEFYQASESLAEDEAQISADR